MPDTLGRVSALNRTFENRLHGRLKLVATTVEPFCDPFVCAHFGHQCGHGGAGGGFAQVSEVPFDQGSEISSQFSRSSRQVRSRLVAPEDGCSDEFRLGRPTSDNGSDVDVAAPRDLLDAQGLVAHLDQKISDGLQNELVERRVAGSTDRSSFPDCLPGGSGHTRSLDRYG